MAENNNINSPEQLQVITDTGLTAMLRALATKIGQLYVKSANLVVTVQGIVNDMDLEEKVMGILEDNGITSGGSGLGFCTFEINSDGDLILNYVGDTPPTASINEDGELIINI